MSVPPDGSWTDHRDSQAMSLDLERTTEAFEIDQKKLHELQRRVDTVTQSVEREKRQHVAAVAQRRDTQMALDQTRAEQLAADAAFSTVNAEPEAMTCALHQASVEEEEVRRLSLDKDAKQAQVFNDTPPDA
jgi:hypothetical protein